MKNAARLITLACIGQILGYAYALPGHLDEPIWSAHAQFHHVLAWIWLLLVLFISAQGGHFMASLVVPAGRPSEPWYDPALTLVALVFAIGLGIAWKALSRPDS